MSDVHAILRPFFEAVANDPNVRERLRERTIARLRLPPDVSEEELQEALRLERTRESMR